MRLFLLIALVLVLPTLASPARAADGVPDIDGDRSRLARLVTAFDAGPEDDAILIAAELRARGRPWPARVDYVLARDHLRNGRFGSAVGLLEGLAGRYPAVADHVLLNLANAYRGIGLFERAEATLQTLLEQFPESDNAPKGRLLLASIYLEDKKPAEALHILEPLGKPDDYRSESNRIRLLRARAALLARDTETAVPILKNIYISMPDTPDAEEAYQLLLATGKERLVFEERLQRAHALKAQRKYDRAARVYEALLAESPDNEEILEALGRSHFGARNYDEAAGVLKRVDTAETRFLETRALYRAGRTGAFLEALERAETDYPELKPRFFRLQLVIGQDDRSEGHYPLARAQFEHLLEHYPEHRPETVRELGWNAFLAGDYDEVLRWFDELAGPDVSAPEDLAAAYWRGRARARLGNPAGAGRNFRAIFDRDPGSYYGWLSASLLPDARPVRVVWHPPRRTPPQRFRRAIELRILGMDAAARSELPGLLRRSNGPEEALLLAWLAGMLDDYRTAIRLADPLSRLRPEFLHFAYPFGYRRVIEDTAAAEAIDPFLLAAVIRVESTFDPRAYSRAGAMGLMQLMPATAERIGPRAGVDIKDDADLFRPEKNIPIGAHYLSRLVRRYEGNLVFAVAAYNAGESAVDRWKNRLEGRPLDVFIDDIPYPETRGYVKKVLVTYMEYQRLWGLTPPSLSAIVKPGEPRAF